MITMMMIMIKQRLWKEIQVYEQPEVRCSSAYLHHWYKTMFFILLSKPSGTIFIRNPNVLMVYCRSRLLRLLFIIGNHWMQSLLWGGGGGCTAARNGHPPWWGNRRVPGSLVTSYFDSRKHFRYRRLSIANLTRYYQNSIYLQEK